VALARVATGARTKADTSAGGSHTLSVALPTGHASGHVIFLFVTTDDNTNTTADPSGWTRLFFVAVGSSTNSPYTPRPRTKCYYIVDNGSLGSSVNVSFSSAAWPAGNPSVIAYTVAYSGADVTGPVERWDFLSTTATTAAMAHPQETTIAASDWLITFRTVSSDSPGATFTNSVGTDFEIQDDVDTINELACATYDSNGGLTAGLQTQRTTTASRAATYGGIAVSIVLKPAAGAGAATASAGLAQATATAFNPSVTTVDGPWNACGPSGMPVYSTAIDWAGNGTFTDPGDDITDDELSGGITITYGRDQTRQLSPGAAGSMSLAVNNSSRKYSPENAASALYGNLDPARNTQAKVTFQSTTSYLFTGRIDDFDIRVSRTDRSVSFSFLDGLALLQGIKLSTPLYQAVRTGQVINIILDAAGWTGPRDIDYGSTVIPFWWAEGTDAFSAIQDIVKSEGPPAIAYQAPDGTFVFRDRHHRLLRTASTTSQATFAAPRLGDCTAPAVSGFHFTDDAFVYSNGWKDIVNSVSFDVDIRQADLDLSAVWSSSDTISLANGESRVLNVSGSDPFMNAVVPVVGTDFTLSGAGTLTVMLDRTSGASVSVTITAVGGSVQVLSMQLRARAVRVVNTIKVELQDGVSISEHGEKSYPDTAPWTGPNDAFALATLIIQHYAERLPIIQLRVVSENPSHWKQVVGRSIGDRITVQYDEMGMNADFFIESITHTIERIWTDRAPVHAVVFGCERCPDAAPSNPFTFDKRGAGFDQGVFDPVASDDPDTIWIWDDPVQGTFDGGLFAT
jgi:hypothetical protein